MLALLNDVLDAAKLESGFMRFNFQTQDISKLIQVCIEEQESLLSARHNEIIFSGFALNAYFDSIRLGQVLSNLISNAIRFSKEGGKIFIVAKPISKDEIQVTIMDEGTGFDGSEMQQIFEHFIQGKTSSDVSEGSGLGLTISRDIIQAHHGRIWVENRVEKEKIVGASVQFTLPINKKSWLNNEHK